MLTAPEAPPLFTRHPEAHLVWMHDVPLQPGQIYLVKTAVAVTPGRVTAVQYAVDVNTLEQKQTTTLGLNEIGVVCLELDRPVAFDTYRQNRDTGSFILIDRFTNATVAAGMVISAAPLEPQRVRPATVFPDSSDATIRLISLNDAAINSAGISVVDLGGEGGAIEFAVSHTFLDYLGKGNRVLFRLRGVDQLEAVARLAYEHTLTFEFDRTEEGISIQIFKRKIEAGSRVPETISM
jgi:sulfate adenylyltransferase subunit 1